MTTETLKEIAPATLVEIFRKIVLIREFEEKVFELFGKNLIPGTLHLYTGQEAVAAGVCQALEARDLVQSTHRGHGHCLAKGADLNRMMAELFGKATGYCKGKGGSMHITDFSVGVLGATGVVASGLPLAAGAALSAKLRKSGQVVACFFGDGASNNGTFHESLNLASLWKLPVVFVCENNLYAMGTRISKAMVLEDVALRAPAYGMPGATADGNDGVEVFLAAREAVARARRGEGPTLLECKTYRHRGHSRFDPAKYRPAKEVEEWLGRDPVRVMRARLAESGALAEEDAEAIVRDARKAVEGSARFAMDSPDPDPSSASEDVFA
ncbi:MAG: thiamine pyrophosphate-dependent dehydrogenase E1 component subunit alpha [Planctomycetes bacterium]|jgi:pyruvate dehydrogenase E1 component alpha subunit|nr:thiamine pyrophosphate-dependent dehydrogenase E1 component subunit alpha [Planctomycetota bacterium]